MDAPGGRLPHGRRAAMPLVKGNREENVGCLDRP